jgi:hypothetical protein
MKGLTVNFGLTAELFTPRTEKYNRQSTVDLSAINPANGLPGALVVAGQGGFGRAFQSTLVRLAPSLSLAWNPRDDAKTVVRTSFSRNYSGIPIYSGQWGTQGFNSYPTYLSPDTQLQPAFLLRNGVPPATTPTPDLQPDAANDTIADLIDMSDRLPTYQSAALSIERELPASTIVTVGFYYQGGKNLLVGNGAANPNAIPLDDLKYGDELNDLAFNQRPVSGGALPAGHGLCARGEALVQRIVAERLFRIQQATGRLLRTLRNAGLLQPQRGMVGDRGQSSRAPRT